MRVLERSRARSAAVLGAAALLTVGLVGCSSDGDSDNADGGADTAASSETRTFEAQNGSIEIPADPQRIVACGYAVLPLIQADANLAAVCEWTRETENMDEETLAAYEELPKVAPDMSVADLNYEAITMAEPDLIIMGVPAMVQEQLDMATLESLAPVVFLGPTIPSECANSASSTPMRRTSVTPTAVSRRSTTRALRNSPTSMPTRSAP